jgi:hypothetical protein
MAEFATDLASDTGLEEDQAHHGVGALLALLKGRLNPEAFSHIQEAIPDSEHMLSAFHDRAASAGGGLLDTMKDMAGKLFGRGDADAEAAVHSHFASAGLSPDQVKNLLPRLHDMLAGKIPPHILDQIKQHVPGFGPPAGREEAE